MRDPQGDAPEASLWHVSTSPVLQAKLRPAATPGYLVSRPRLDDLLDAATESTLTLVVAPAGAGKTSLVRSWWEQKPEPRAWLSLDETDRDPTQLWWGILAALEGVAPGCSVRAGELLRLPDHLPQAVGALLDDLESRDYDRRVLVLDDLQLVDDVDAIEATLGSFVQHLPGWLHVTVCTRRTPHLPLHRLRARGQLGEVTFAELRFSLDEAATMLRNLAPTLAADRVEEVAGRAGGWAASIQLAALAARADHAQAALDAPSHDDGSLHLRDYVWREVLANESPDVVEVMLATSIVARVAPGLAEALTGRADALAVLDLAEERGLFITRIDPVGTFEIHALVRDVLMAVAESRDPGALAALHARAARWYEETGQIVSALEHLIRAGRPRDALRLLWQQEATLYDSGRESSILRTMAEIPASIATVDVESMIEYAWCHLLVDRQRFLETVDYVSGWTRHSGDVDPVHESRLLVLRAIAATIQGHWRGTPAGLERALDLLDGAWMVDPLGQFAWNMLAREVALSERWDDTGEETRRILRTLSITPERRLGFEGVRALGLSLAGNPVDTLRVVAGARQAAEVTSMTILSTELAIAEAIALREIGDAPAALRLLTEVAHTRVEAVPYAELLAWLELVRMHVDSGDLQPATEAFGRAVELVETDLGGPGTRDWLACAGVVLAQARGDLEEARSWAAQVTDPFWSGLSMARVLIASGEPSAAADVLKTIEPSCPHQHTLRELLLSRSVTDRSLAEEHLSEAVRTAVDHGLVQTLASEGIDVVESVERLAWRAPESWLDRLRRATVPTSTRGAERAIGLIEVLTEREVEVLRLLPSRLTQREIADELFISLNTLKFHLRVIYRKLECSSRAEAAEMARALTGLRRTHQPSSARRR